MNGKFKLYPKEQGHVFIMVLIFSLLLAFMATSALESTSLQFKMSENFAEHLLEVRQAEVALKKAEQNLEQNFFEVLPQGVNHLQFVPDTLIFEEPSGVNYYQLANTKRKATLALR